MYSLLVSNLSIAIISFSWELLCPSKSTLLLYKRLCRTISKAWWAGRDLNPHELFTQRILSPHCLPIPAPARVHGGAYEICTRVQGFADPCLTPRPTRHTRLLYQRETELEASLAKFNRHHHRCCRADHWFERLERYMFSYLCFHTRHCQ
jgi:hypothetical protein